MAFLNPVANITVTCDIMGVSAYWNVNGTYLNNLTNNSDLYSDHDPHGMNLFNCSLYIPAKAKYNGTVVQCVALVPGNGQVESQDTTILIQGIACYTSLITFADE